MTRMWMVEPWLLCRRHLIGEHGELHQILGHIESGNLKAVQGLVRKGYLDTALIRERHDALAAEMERRGYNHDSPVEYSDALGIGGVDLERSRTELASRCSRCAARLVEDS